MENRVFRNGFGAQLRARGSLSVCAEICARFCVDGEEREKKKVTRIND